MIQQMLSRVGHGVRSAAVHVRRVGQVAVVGLGVAAASVSGALAQTATPGPVADATSAANLTQMKTDVTALSGQWLAVALLLFGFMLAYGLIRKLAK